MLRLAEFQGPPSLWSGSWLGCLWSVLLRLMFAAWSYCVVSWLKKDCFCASLIGLLTLLTLELDGRDPVGNRERLRAEKAHHKSVHAGRPNSTALVVCKGGINMWRACGLTCSMLRLLQDVLGGMESFLPCRIEADHCRLRLFGVVWRPNCARCLAW